MDTRHASLKNKTLTLFFTYGVSLEIWQRSGTLERDLALYNRLREQGMNIVFVTYGGKEDVEIGRGKGFSVIANTKKLPQIIYFILLPFFVKQQCKNIHIVKSHQFIGTLPAIVTAKIHKVQYVARGGYLPTLFFKQYKKKFFSFGWLKLLFSSIDEWLITRFADVITVPSTEEIAYLDLRHPSFGARIETIPNWVDTKQFLSLPSITKERDILFVGRFETQKNPLLFLESIKGIQNVRATMIGGGSLFSEIKTYIEKFTIDCIVHETKVPNEQLPEIINKHKVAVLPTSFEGGSPKTLLEAMACGLPIISTDTFGTRNLFSQNSNVGVMCTLDANTIQKAIVRLLSNPEEYQIMAKCARHHVEKNFSLSVVLQKEIDVLASL
jgi:glycosyltransferase involved in cell wall biosynthesis